MAVNSYFSSVGCQEQQFSLSSACEILTVHALASSSPPGMQFLGPPSERSAQSVGRVGRGRAAPLAWSQWPNALPWAGTRKGSRTLRNTSPDFLIPSVWREAWAVKCMLFMGRRPSPMSDLEKKSSPISSLPSSTFSPHLFILSRRIWCYRFIYSWFSTDLLSSSKKYTQSYYLFSEW